jgi:hypothetical protein
VIQIKRWSIFSEARNFSFRRRPRAKRERLLRADTKPSLAALYARYPARSRRSVDNRYPPKPEVQRMTHDPPTDASLSRQRQLVPRAAAA